MGSRNELKPTVVGRADGGIIPRILVGSRNELKPTIVGRANGGIIPPTWWVYPPYFLQCVLDMFVHGFSDTLGGGGMKRGSYRRSSEIQKINSNWPLWPNLTDSEI